MEFIVLNDHDLIIRIICFARQAFDTSLEQFQAAATERPASAEPHVYLALLHANAGRTDAAIQEANAAVAIDRDTANRVLASALQRPITIDDFVRSLRPPR